MTFLRKWSDGLRIEQRGPSLAVDSTYNAYPFGLVWSVLAVAIFVAGVRNGSIDMRSPSSVMACIIFVVVGIGILTVRSIRTEFDASTRSIVQHRAVFGVTWRTRHLDSGQLSGVLFKLDSDDCRRSRLYLVSNDGARMLVAYDDRIETCLRAFEAIHGITGLTRLPDE